MQFFIKNKFLLAFLSFFFLITSCGSLPKMAKPDWSKPIEPNASKRAAENARQGKGIRLFDKSNKSAFATSNPMWRATLDIIDFMSVASSDYSGGVIITDWYSEGNPDESIKLNIRFLTNEIRADGINISLYKRTCKGLTCSTKKIDNKLIFELKDKILKTAAVYKEQDLDEYLKAKPKVYNNN